MLAALTGIDRHESCFAVSKEAPAKVDSFDRGFPTKGVIAGFDHRKADTSSGVKIIEGPHSCGQKNGLQEVTIPCPLLNHIGSIL